MKIEQKLTLSFVGVALLIGAAGYISLSVSQEALQESIGESSASSGKEEHSTSHYQRGDKVEKWNAPPISKQ